MWRNGTISTFNKQLTYSNLNNSHNYKKEKIDPLFINISGSIGV